MAMIVATLLLVRYASERPEDFAAEDHLERSERFAATAPRPEPAPTAPALETMPVASAGFAAPVVEEHAPEPVLKARPRKVVTVAPAKKHAAASAKTSAKSTAPITAPVIATTGKTAKADAAVVAPASSVSTEIVGPAPVTVTGCLEMSVDRDEFRLTDTEGADAPKARSWRSGFLKKRPAAVALLAPPDPHGLERQVGKRVAATGQLFDRDLKVSSVRVVGASCDN